ncbi:MAG: proprotein convertase P-domain-containing protein [Deltaproteobacteria bacterium]|nr:proprotein convertase P-domain-containing protein [Deltaproteobacteria bacterium]
MKHGRKSSRGVLSPGVIVAAVLMVGVGFGAAWVVDRHLLPRLAGGAAEPSADAGAAPVVPDAATAPDAATTAGNDPAAATDAPPNNADVVAESAGDDAPPPTLDGLPVAVGEVPLPEYQFRTRREGDPAKVFSWVEVEVPFDGVVGDVVLETDLKNCPRDADGRLVSPQGTSVLLWSERGTTREWDEVQGSFPDSLESLESLCAFRGEPARGPWRLRIGDSRGSCHVLLRSARLRFQPPTRPCPADDAPAAPSPAAGTR